MLLLPGSLDAQNQRQSFQEFRKGVLSGYSDFRKTILERYADFLNGEWHEYESLNGESRDRTPKPKEVPAAQPVTPRTSAPGVSGEIPGKVTENTVVPPLVERSGEESFLFYNLPIVVPEKEFQIAYRLSSPADYSRQWKELAASDAVEIIAPIKKKAQEMGLNDYLTYELIKAYINCRFPQADDSSKMSAIHFLLANSGYDARIATTTRGVPLLLLPFEQTIFGRTYMMMPEGKYYVFAPDGIDAASLASEVVKTCTIPSDMPRGEKFNLLLEAINIPVSPKEFDLQFGAIHLKGEVNENLMPILYRYPQMPIEDYAVSNPDPELRKKLAAQLRSQLSDMKGDEAVEEFLGFMHNVFDYSTDEDFHGFEKPYFIEETLYYPKNDCEDRAIFYTYFLWNALGKEAQLVSFPGHEAATVKLDNEIKGKSYKVGNETFYISDPTYIGSHTGLVMPAYERTTPKVDYTFR